MNADWFEPVVQKWSDSSITRAKMCAILMDISRASGGEPVDDGSAPLDETDRRDWAISVALDAVQARLNLLARNLVEHRQDRRFLDKTGWRGPFEHPDVERAQWSQSVSLNTASISELEALPIIGPVLAQRIIEHRVKHGPFSSLEELSRIPGFSTETIDALRILLMVDDNLSIFPRISELENFVADPTFELLANFVRRTGASFLEQSSDVLDADDNLLMELKSVWKRVSFTPPPSAKFNRRTSTAIGDHLALRRKGSALIDTASKEIEGAVPIKDGEYLDFARRLIEQAKSSIQIIMFFMRYDPLRTTPLNQLIDSLVEAHQRGVEVQVLLDTDLPDDPAMSRAVNRVTFQRLTESGVAVRLDSPERSTHSKLVLVDGRSIIIGSHNWTLGSMRRYDDASVYIEAKSIGAAYERRFELLWKKA